MNDLHLCAFSLSVLIHNVIHRVDILFRFVPSLFILAGHILVVGGNYPHTGKEHQPSLLQELSGHFPGISKGYILDKGEDL